MSKNVVPLNTEQEESPNRLSFTLEDMLEEFDNGAVPRSQMWRELITALYDTANHVVTGVTAVADVKPDNLGNIPLLPKDIGAISQAVTHLTLEDAIADDNSNRQFLKLGNRGQASYRRAVSETEYNITHPSAKFIDTLGVMWVLLVLGNIHADWFGDSVGSGSDDTVELQALADYVGGRSATIEFTQGKTYNISKKVDFSGSRKNFIAYGAKFNITTDTANSYAFDLNPDVDMSNIEGTSKSYIFWNGGEFFSSVTNPVQNGGIKAHGIRQLTVRDAIFGISSGNRLYSGINFAFLGGHLFEKNRFLNVKRSLYSPNMGSSSDVSVPTTTTTGFNNEFILGTGQRAISLEGGFNRFRIYGGFINSSENESACYFAARNDARSLSIRDVGFEQAKNNSKYIFIEDVEGRVASNVLISGCTFNGDPANGSHIHVDLERTWFVTLSANRLEASRQNGNLSIRADSNCKDFNFQYGNFFAIGNNNAGVELNFARRHYNMLQSNTPIRYLDIEGIFDHQFTTGNQTLNMSLLLGGDYPAQGNPKGYTFLLAMRDSSSGYHRVTMSDNSFRPSTQRVGTTGNQADIVINNEIYVPADDDGNVYLEYISTGTNTLTIWLTLVVIHN